jgi:enterochelin esterase-like enzyme
MSNREEAAPTFANWKNQLETASPIQLPQKIARFLQILKTLGTPMVEGGLVTFVYYGPHARDVELSGEFNQWAPHGQAIRMERLAESGFFYHTIELNEPARLEYKFIVDGEWQLDSFCPNQVDNGLGDRNSFFAVGDFHEPPELQWVDEVAHGRVDEFEFASNLLENRRTVYVYLPAVYSVNGRRFAAVYVHDGGEYLQRAKMATVLDNLIAKGDIPPLISVMVDPVDRMTEYWANDRYLTFLAEELVPEIDKRYRTVADRGQRAVIGASLGGLISIYAALSYPDLFSLVGGQSSALMLEEQKLANLVASTKRTSFRFYFDVGKYEPSFIPAHRRLVGLLRKRWAVLYQELPGGHNWTNWRAHLRAMLIFLWQPSRSTPPVRRISQRSPGKRTWRSRN